MIKLISTLVVKRCYGVYINSFTPGNFANEKRPLKLVAPVLFAQFFFFFWGGGVGGLTRLHYGAKSFGESF